MAGRDGLRRRQQRPRSAVQSVAPPMRHTAEMHTGATDRLESLPDACLESAAAFLDAPALAALGACWRGSRAAADSEHLWEKLCLALWANKERFFALRTPLSVDGSGTWRSSYAFSVRDALRTTPTLDEVASSRWIVSFGFDAICRERGIWGDCSTAPSACRLHRMLMETDSDATFAWFAMAPRPTRRRAGSYVDRHYARELDRTGNWFLVEDGTLQLDDHAPLLASRRAEDWGWVFQSTVTDGRNRHDVRKETCNFVPDSIWQTYTSW